MVRFLLFVILVSYIARGFRERGPVLQAGTYGVVVGFVLVTIVVAVVTRRLSGGLAAVPCVC